MIQPIRVSPEEVQLKSKSGAAILVCAYDDEGMFSQMHLQGAISMKEFKSRLPALGKDLEIIFYCG